MSWRDKLNKVTEQIICGSEEAEQQMLQDEIRKAQEEAAKKQK